MLNFAETLSIFCLCFEAFQETKTKVCRVINMVEKISKYYNIQYVAIIMLDSVWKIYNQNHKERISKYLNFGSQRTMFKMGAKAGMAARDQNQHKKFKKQAVCTTTRIKMYFKASLESLRTSLS